MPVVYIKITRRLCKLLSAWWNDTPGTQWESASLEVVIGVFTRWRNQLTLLSDNWEILLVNHVFILVRTGRITLWMKILVSQTIARRHAICHKKLVHAFATDLKANGLGGPAQN